MNVEPRIDDETLMAYADGELEAAQRREIEASMAADPGIAARIAEHTALRARLHAAFDPVLDEPVPERLLAALQPVSATTARVVALDERRAGKTAAGDRRAWSWPEWGAMAASVVVGIVISQRLMTTGQPIVARNGDLYAQGVLATALTEQLASEPSAAGSEIFPGISFRNSEGVYCRTFQLAAQAGLACRDGEQWRVQALAETEAPASPETYRMAAAALPPVIRAAVEGTMDGEPLDAVAEADALSRGWR